MAQRTLSTVRVETAPLVSLLLCVLSWELTAAVFLGRWLLAPVGFGPHREWAALAVSLALSLYHAAWGRRHARRYYLTTRRRREALTGRQALIVAALAVLAGAFGTWLFVQGRG